MSLVEFLIDNQLFAEAAEGKKLSEGPDFESRLNYLKRRALRELYFEKVIKASVTDADAKKIYDDQVKLLKPEEEAQARHILVESEEKAKEIAEKLKNGGDFAALAKENSKDPGSKDNGGDLGYFSRGQMVPQFEEAVFKLEQGRRFGAGEDAVRLPPDQARGQARQAAAGLRGGQGSHPAEHAAEQGVQGCRGIAVARPRSNSSTPTSRKSVEERNKQIEAAPNTAEPKKEDAKPEEKKPEEKK